MGWVDFKSDQKSSANGAQDNSGAKWGSTNGDWVVNIPVSSGSGLSLQGGASSGLSKWMLIGGGLVVVAGIYFLRRRR